MPNKRVHADGRAHQGGLSGKVGTSRGTRRGSGSSPRKLTSSSSSDQQAKLHARLKTAEETLRAIQSGEVDALMVSGHRGEHLVTLKGGEPNYRMLVEAMSEGAATLSRDGVVLYCNRSLADLLCRPTGRIIGTALKLQVAETERGRFETFLSDAQKRAAKGEFNLRCTDGSLIPVHLSLNRLRGYKGDALGMVITDLREQRHKQAAEIKQAEAVSRLLLVRTISAQEEERRRIARELHDESGQLLTALLVGLRTLEDTRTLAEVKVQGQRLREITAQAIDEVGRLARGLHPTVLDDHGLGVALSRYSAEYTKSHNITVNLTLHELDSSNLPSAVQITLYRILQEALTNVARHSGAKTVSIRLNCSARSVEAEVIDDGCGFDVKAVSVSSHRLGIQSMRERAAMLGGTVNFTSNRKGTKILVQIPLVHQDVQLIAVERNA
jgi:PAS domain S-box-containing protein